jgi:hypothetical protein
MPDKRAKKQNHLKGFGPAPLEQEDYGEKRSKSNTKDRYVKPKGTCQSRRVPHFPRSVREAGLEGSVLKATCVYLPRVLWCWPYPLFAKGARNGPPREPIFFRE